MQPEHETTPEQGTRMWGVVTPRGKVLAVSPIRTALKRGWSFEIEHAGAKVLRVLVTVEMGNAGR